MKRITLFLIVNVLVMIMLSLIMAVFRVQPYLERHGINYQALAVFCLLWGFGGAFISLALSRIMAKFAMGVRVIDPNDPEPNRRQLVSMVHRLARDAGLTVMPEVGVYESPEVNAFATGPTRSRSLVAVSTGLLNRLDRNEVEAVLGHEIGHVANGDMVTMTLIQGIVNAFVMFLSRVLAFAIATASRGGDRRDDRGGDFSYGMYYLVQMLLEIALMIPASMLVCWFSRQREYRADRAGATLAGRQNMIGALRALQAESGRVEDHRAPSLQTLMISSRGTGLMRFFMTHPPLEERIARLKAEA
jgi:heat shock protein HtpX